MAYDNINTAFVQNYGQTVFMMAQQKESRLINTVLTETPTGKRHYFDLYNKHGDMNTVTNRFSPIAVADTKFERRAVDLVDYDFANLVDNFDKLKLLIDPSSSITQAQSAQVARKLDKIVIDAFFADMKTGETGAGTSALPAGQQVAVNYWGSFGSGSGNAALTVPKLIRAAQILDANEVPLDERFFVVDAFNHSALLASAEVASRDFNVKPVLVDGRINDFMGFKFILSEQLPTDGSGYRRCVAYQKSGMGVAMPLSPTADISQRKDITSLPYQYYMMLSMAGTRLENEKVVEVKCLAS
jgi:hypothetical protein